MNILNIIEKKINKEELTKEEICYVVSEYTKGNIPDYQMSSLLTAININDMSDEETFHLTDAMLNSGETLHFDFKTVDKHSTGGVGDKTTLILAPLVASAGSKVVKMSGKGLGHTGGTIDKLESINGFKTKISFEDLNKQVEEIGVAVVGQMGNLCPADKKIYALRDVTSNVKSIPLIASSIMSKKLASGSENIVIDLKVGRGALLTTYEDAKKLGELMVKIGKKYNRKTVCVLSNMSEPLGNAIGNSLEVLESLATLNNRGPKDLTTLVSELATIMVSLDQNIDMVDAKIKIFKCLDDLSAKNKFYEMVNFQGGDLKSLKISKNKKDILSPVNGYIKEIDALRLGELARKLGAGRLTLEDQIDYEVGFVLHKKVGDYVGKDEVLITMYYNKVELELMEVLSSYIFSAIPVEKEKLIYEVIK